MEALVIFLTLTFQLRPLILESHQTICPIELKFYVKTSYDKFMQNLCKIILSHDQDDRHAHIW